MKRVEIADRLACPRALHGAIDSVPTCLVAQRGERPSQQRGPVAERAYCKAVGEGDHAPVIEAEDTGLHRLHHEAQGEVVRSVTGHVTERMTEHYSHVSRDEKSSAMAKVFSIVRPPKAPAAEVGDLVGDASG